MIKFTTFYRQFFMLCKFVIIIDDKLKQSCKERLKYLIGQVNGFQMIEYYENGKETFKTFVKFSDVNSVHVENATRLFNQREWNDLNIYRTKRRIEASKSLYLAKKSIMAFLGIGMREIRSISLLKGVFGQPVIVNNNNSSMNIGISLHTRKKQ